MARKNRGGRPRKNIDFTHLKKLCDHMHTGEECADILGVDYDTLNARITEAGYEGFPDYFKKNSGGGKASLRRMQWKTAQKGNVTMQIWLGKQYLGQTDKSDIKQEGVQVIVNDNIPDK